MITRRCAPDKHAFTLDTVAGIIRCVLCGSIDAWDESDPRTTEEREA